jgi:hypothetical protein
MRVGFSLVGAFAPLVLSVLLFTLPYAFGYGGDAPSCMAIQDYQNHEFFFEGPWPVSGTNKTCITNFGQCDPNNTLPPGDCGCTCICKPGFGGHFCNETLASTLPYRERATYFPTPFLYSLISSVPAWY